MNKIILSSSLILALSFMACNHQTKSNTSSQKVDSKVESTISEVKNLVSIFEIPATDFSRAVEFYQAVLSIKIEEMEMPGLQMGIFPSEGQIVFGVIVKGEDYKPSANGVTIYLNAGNDLQVVLDKVEKHGGKVLVPKTPHGDESGYFAMLLDTEGNRLGLHSPH